MASDTLSDIDSNVREAVTIGIRYIGISVYPSGKVRNFLIKNGYSYEVVNEAINIIIKRGYIDDIRAGRKIITSRIGKKQESKNYIYQRLIQYGVSDSDANILVSELDDDDITCRRLFDSLIPESTCCLNDELELFLCKRAHQRGYSSSVINRVLRNLFV